MCVAFNKTCQGYVLICESDCEDMMANVGPHASEQRRTRPQRSSRTHARAQKTLGRAAEPPSLPSVPVSAPQQRMLPSRASADTYVLYTFLPRGEHKHTPCFTQRVDFCQSSAGGQSPSMGVKCRRAQSSCMLRLSCTPSSLPCTSVLRLAARTKEPCRDHEAQQRGDIQRSGGRQPQSGSEGACGCWSAGSMPLAERTLALCTFLPLTFCGIARNAFR